MKTIIIDTHEKRVLLATDLIKQGYREDYAKTTCRSQTFRKGTQIIVLFVSA